MLADENGRSLSGIRIHHRAPLPQHGSTEPTIERLRRIETPRPAWSNSETSHVPLRTEIFSASSRLRCLHLRRSIPPLPFTPRRLAAISIKSRATDFRFQKTP